MTGSGNRVSTNGFLMSDNESARDLIKNSYMVNDRVHI